MRYPLPFAILMLMLAAGSIQPASAQLAPPLGGVPAGANVGIGLQAGGVSGSLRLNLGQSSSRSIVGTSAGVTTMDGYPGFIQSTVTRPFVTGFIPIVGGYPEMPNPAAEVARHNKEPLSRVQQSQQNLRNQSLQKYLRRALRADEEGNKRVARANYKLAIRIADKPLRSQLQWRLKEMLREDN